jgi:hypothetical protein
VGQAGDTRLGDTAGFVGEPEDNAGRRSTWATVVLAVVFATFVLGPYPVSLSAAGARIQLWRMVLLVVIAVLVPGVTRPLRGRAQLPTLFVGVGLAWLGWGLVSFAWAPSFVSGSIELIGLVDGLVLAVTIAVVGSRSQDHLRVLVACWTVGLAVEAGFSLLELLTGFHLPSPFQTAMAELGVSTRFLTGTLGNPNDVAAFLLVGLPFCISGVALWRSRAHRIGAAITAVAAITVIGLSNSRLCTAGLGIGAISYALLMKRGRRPYRLRLAYLMSLIAPLALVLAQPRLVSKFKNLATEWSGGGSARDRLLLIRHGWDVAYASSFRGNGIGGYEPSVRALPHQLASSGDVNPHNFAMELFSQYGIVVTALFLMWFVLSFQAVRRERLRLVIAGTLDQRVHVLTAAYVGFIIFIPASSDPSSFIEQGTGWLLLGSLLAVVPNVRPFARAVE